MDIFNNLTLVEFNFHSSVYIISFFSNSEFLVHFLSCIQLDCAAVHNLLSSFSICVFLDGKPQMAKTFDANYLQPIQN